MTTLKSLMAILLVAAVASMVALATEIPFEQEWAESGHADATSEAFSHWSDPDPCDPNILIPGNVSGSCARCHSGTGFQDFVGADGSAVGTVDSTHLDGAVVGCATCHNSGTIDMDTVQFPGVEPNYPGVTVTGLGAEARCMQCHQGRESTASMHQEIDDAEVVDDDTIDSDLGFQNVHYAAAGATQLGGEAMGGYQYDGKMYDIGFAHTDGIESCIDCHDPHTLEVKVEVCSDCHEGVVEYADLADIRFLGSTKDYDGDGDLGEGILGEIETIQPLLYAAILDYAGNQGAPVLYDSHSHPYWFNDNGGGSTRSNAYESWTARLLKGAYNYQFSMKDHGAYAHNAKSLIQLMYDSIEDLGGSVANLTRGDAGHFDGSTEAWRHWDGDDEVSSGCTKCHSADGLPFYLETGVSTGQEISNGLECSTCHDAVPGYTRHEVEEVEFPSGAVLDTGDPNSNLCINCHQGRESAVSINSQIAGKDLDTADSSLRFRNSHYYPAGATLFGSEAKGGYEYPGMDYSGRSRHLGFPAIDNCIECHDAHSLEVNTDACKWCHNVTQGVRTIRMTPGDFDGDGDATEPLADEIDTMHHDLYLALQAYAAANTTPIIYGGGYPYWFVDTNGNGEVDPGEDTRSNGYSGYTPRLLQACYNYQFIKKDPGGFAHNGTYVMQLLYDGIESLGGDVSLMLRPGAVNASNVCGDPTHPYPEGDLNLDCNVNFLDIAIIGLNWLENTL